MEQGSGDSRVQRGWTGWCGGGGGGGGGLIWFPGPPVAQTHIPVLPPLPVPGKSGG